MNAPLPLFELKYQADDKALARGFPAEVTLVFSDDMTVELHSSSRAEVVKLTISEFLILHLLHSQYLEVLKHVRATAAPSPADGGVPRVDEPPAG